MAHREREVRSQLSDTEISNRGILSSGTLVADYYTAEPSPDKWIAVGTVMFWPVRDAGGVPKWMLVGQGRNERQAVDDLHVRMSKSIPPRWKIKCDQAPSGSTHSADLASSDVGNRYVVPWEISTDDLGAIATSTMSDLAASQAMP